MEGRAAIALWPKATAGVAVGLLLLLLGVEALLAVGLLLRRASAAVVVFLCRHVVLG